MYLFHIIVQWCNHNNHEKDWLYQRWHDTLSYKLEGSTFSDKLTEPATPTVSIKKKKKKKKKHTQVISRTLCLYRDSAHFEDVRWTLRPIHIIPWNTINQGLLQPQGELYNLVSRHLTFTGGIRSTCWVLYKFLQDNLQWVPCPTEFKANSIFMRALVLTGLKPATSCTGSERCVAWCWKPARLTESQHPKHLGGCWRLTLFRLPIFHKAHCISTSHTWVLRASNGPHYPRGSLYLTFPCSRSALGSLPTKPRLSPVYRASVQQLRMPC